MFCFKFNNVNPRYLSDSSPSKMCTMLSIYDTYTAWWYKLAFIVTWFECSIIMQAAGVRFPAGPDLRIFSSPVTFGAQRLVRKNKEQQWQKPLGSVKSRVVKLDSSGQRQKIVVRLPNICAKVIEISHVQTFENLMKSLHEGISQLAFYINLKRTVIGPSATLTGR